MKLRADFHTHTTYCDGKSTPRQMVEAAYRMGLTDLGISGHADYSMWEPGFGMSDEALAAYKQELEALREEDAGKINRYIAGTGAAGGIRHRIHAQCLKRRASGNGG